jgi:hypothetical protein
MKVLMFAITHRDFLSEGKKSESVDKLQFRMMQKESTEEGRWRKEFPRHFSGRCQKEDKVKIYVALKTFPAQLNFSIFYSFSQALGTRTDKIPKAKS